MIGRVVTYMSVHPTARGRLVKYAGLSTARRQVAKYDMRSFLQPGAKALQQLAFCLENTCGSPKP